tara:strand:- start:1658 stop:2032 length:375 start_codon:yes stop_codon:yes gene_type:complete
MTGNCKRMPNGSYRSNDGKTYAMLIGSPRQVWNETAYKTGYGKRSMTRKKLLKKKDGRIVSKARSMTAKKNKNLGKYIDMARKNKGKRGFKAMRKGMTNKKNNTRGVRKTRRKCRNTRGKYKKC